MYYDLKNNTKHCISAQNKLLHISCLERAVYFDACVCPNGFKITIYESTKSLQTYQEHKHGSTWICAVVNRKRVDVIWTHAHVDHAFLWFLIVGSLPRIRYIQYLQCLASIIFQGNNSFKSKYFRWSRFVFGCYSMTSLTQYMYT